MIGLLLATAAGGALALALAYALTLPLWRAIADRL
jgi:riboflavin transporter FmnP